VTAQIVAVGNKLCSAPFVDGAHLHMGPSRLPMERSTIQRTTLVKHIGQDRYCTARKVTGPMVVTVTRCQSNASANEPLRQTVQNNACQYLNLCMRVSKQLRPLLLYHPVHHFDSHASDSVQSLLITITSLDLPVTKLEVSNQYYTTPNCLSRHI